MKTAIYIFLTAALTIACSSTSTTYADIFGSGLNTFSIDFVTIGNPGNADDVTGDPNPAGRVNYTYRMGQFEISEEMINKANAQDALGITQDNRGANKPATSISWYEAARFVNWLNAEHGSTPAYKFNSAGDFLLWQPADAGYDANNQYRNVKAQYFLPSMDEWYKAAYYDPTADVYYDYTTDSNDVPDGIDFAGDTNFDAVFFDGASNLDPNDITDVGVSSPYGTAGQGGNVWEWEETASDLLNNSVGAARGARGGRWNTSAGSFFSSNRGGANPFLESNDIGFRVASVAVIVPEPTTFSLLFLAGLLAVPSRRQRAGSRSLPQ